MLKVNPTEGLRVPVAYETFQEMKQFLEFNEADADNLVALAPVFAKHGEAITDSFYETLGRFEVTSKLIAGRVESLKRTHREWMSQLFLGEYNESYFNRRMRIGLVHAKIGIEPRWVEGVMSVLRSASLAALRQEIPDVDILNARYQSLLKILDLDLLIINLAYSEEMFDRLTTATGMRRPLLINLIRRAVK